MRVIDGSIGICWLLSGGGSSFSASESDPGGAYPKSGSRCSTSQSAAGSNPPRIGGVVDSKLDGIGLDGSGDCSDEDCADGDTDGLESGGKDSSVWCFVRICFVRPPVLRKCRGQWGHVRVGGGEPRVKVF
jgi:hypothetical protein